LFCPVLLANVDTQTASRKIIEIKLLVLIIRKKKLVLFFC
jgi:hypothetical protein